MFGMKNLEEKLNNLQLKIELLEEKITNFESRIESYDSSFQEYMNLKKQKETDEPYIEIISQSFSSEHGVELKLDWNPAMINYLKRNGYVGVDEDQIIQKYMADLLRDQVDNSIPS